MTFEIFNIISNALQISLGGTVLLPLLLVGTIAILLFSIKAGYNVFIIIAAPLIVGLLGVTTASWVHNGLTEEMKVFAIGAILSLGIMMAGAFWKITRG
jgi:hypothetical protein